MGQAWSSVRRRTLFGLIGCAFAAAAWAPPVSAASTNSGEVVAVGHPAVTVLTAGGKRDKEGKDPVKHARPADEDGLKRAKERATTSEGASGLAAVSGPSAGVFNGTNGPGISSGDVGFCCTPPDSTGSIGPNNYVEFVNTQIAVYDRSLGRLASMDMASFVAAPSGYNVSDPQVQWDPRAGRWFYAAIAFVLHSNYLVFGWSTTADPSNLSGGWCRFGAFTGNQIADYPKLGHDDNFVLFGANLYDDSSGNYVFSTAVIYAQPKPPPGNLTSCSASGFTAFADPSHKLLNADGTSAFTPIPVNISDASPAGFIVAGHSPVAPRPTDPTGPQTKVMLWHTALQGGTPHLFADGDLTVGSFDVPASAPQPGGPTLDTLDARLTQAVAHADPDVGGAEAVWTQHTINGAGGRSVVRWYEILPASKTVRQQGTIQSSTDFLWNAAISPSIAGNDAGLTYNRGSATQLPVVAAQARVGSTPLSALSGGEAVLATSSATDSDLSCSSPYGPPCRWGDYAGMSPDPINAGVVWGANQFNGTPLIASYPAWATQIFAVTTNGTPPPPPTPCTSVTWNAPSPASPSAPGTQVTFSGTAGGCPNPVYQFWVQPPGGSWSIIRAYSSASTATWNTSGLAQGTYLFDIWAKQAGSTADWEAHISPNPTYTLQNPNTCTSVTWNNPSPASPQAPGAQVTLTGTASGCPNPTYQFWVQPQGGSWTVLQAYSPSPTATWNTSGLATGTYNFDIWARQSGSSAQWEAHISPNPTYMLQTGAPCTSVTFSANPASPQTAGASVTLTGAASGCPSPQYEFWIQPPGGSWSTLQGYSANSTTTWDTSGLAAGTYLFDVWARQAGSSADWEAHVSPNPTYTLNAPIVCTSVSWNNPNPAPPQAPGVQVTVGGIATGCPNPLYQFWVQPQGGAWTLLQAYSPNPTATWNTSGLATGTYLFDVWSKQSGSSAQWEAHISPNPTYVLQTGAPCASVGWNTPNPQSPQPPGTQITLGGTASGCPSPQYEFWILPPGGSWAIFQAYSSGSSAVWNTGGAATGQYLFDIWVKQSGSSAQWEAHISPNPSYTIQTGPPCTSVTLTFNPASPQKAGTSVMLTAAAAGCPDATYEFWVLAPGGSWSMLQAYTSGTTVTWNTTGLAPGTYLFDVWTRENGSTSQYEAHISPNPTYTLN